MAKRLSQCTLKIFCLQTRITFLKSAKLKISDKYMIDNKEKGLKQHILNGGTFLL